MNTAKGIGIVSLFAVFVILSFYARTLIDQGLGAEAMIVAMSAVMAAFFGIYCAFLWFEEMR